MGEDPHPRNAPGPFYVVDECCTACDVPVTEAPDLFAYSESNHCYVKRQPQTADEVDQTMRAVLGAEFECIRYRGHDRDVLRRFAELGLPHLSDVPPPSIQPVIRDVAVFELRPGSPIPPSAIAILDSFSAFLVENNAQRESRGLNAEYAFRFENVTGDAAAASLDLSWFEHNWHTVECLPANVDRCWQILHFSAGRLGARGVSNLLDHWLKTSGAFADVRWLCASQPDAVGRSSPQ